MSKQQSSSRAGARGGKNDSLMQNLVQAESLIQLALVLPAAVFIGWLLGLWLDKVFHQHWIYIVGILLGATAGFMQIFRVVGKAMREP
jgi:ATP synthase protein I